MDEERVPYGWDKKNPQERDCYFCGTRMEARWIPPAKWISRGEWEYSCPNSKDLHHQELETEYNRLIRLKNEQRETASLRLKEILGKEAKDLETQLKTKIKLAHQKG